MEECNGSARDTSYCQWNRHGEGCYYIRFDHIFTTVRIRKSNDSGEGDESDEEGDESDEEGDESDEEGDEEGDESDEEELEDEDQAKSQDDVAVEVPVTDLSVGKWVVVNYDGEKYPGEVTSCSEEIEVSVMHKSGRKFWKWPGSIDKLFYEKKRCPTCD